MRCTALSILLFLTATLAEEDRPLKVADPSLNQLRGLLTRYEADRRALDRSNSVPMSSRKRKRLGDFYRQWQYELERINFDKLAQDQKIDYLLLANQLRYKLQTLAIDTKRDEEVAVLVPFSDQIVKLAENRRDMKAIDPKEAAETLVGLGKQLDQLTTQINAGELKLAKTVANRAARKVDSLRRSLAEWQRFYDGYDPMFTWWAKTPYKNTSEQLTDYARLVRRKLAGVEDDDTILGDPIGNDALLTELRYEMIPYTPEELLEIADQEFAWCEREMKRAATDLGFDGDWKKALEHVKGLHVEPGKQPQLIRSQALEAIEFLEKRNLVTIPPLCREIWRMTMMSPERQKISPYFLGGETIQVSFPTASMDHASKLMSLRGNNIHFARATVHHELIPGHHLQGFMAQRFRSHRRQFTTPFLVEGWALHWEMLLWDLNFQRSAEDRVGMLFWRAHRCARIIFSLKFHLNKMTAQECIEFLIERVGHERNNATAEVRRSVSGSYGSLYQAAYMLGGQQMRALHQQLVGGGKMTNREFHDAVLLESSIPLEMIRASLLGTKLTRDYEPAWRFYKLNAE